MLTQTQHTEATAWIEKIDQCGDNVEKILKILDKFLATGLPYYAVLDKVFEKITLLDPRLETVAAVWHKLYGKGKFYPGWKYFPDEGYGFWDTELDGEDEEVMMASTWDFQRLWWRLSDEALEAADDFYSTLAIARISSGHSKANERVHDLASTPEHALAWLEYQKDRSVCTFCERDEKKLLELATTNRVRLALLNYNVMGERGLRDRARAQLQIQYIAERDREAVELRRQSAPKGFTAWLTNLLSTNLLSW